jgi:hypothetical protein
MVAVGENSSLLQNPNWRNTVVKMKAIALIHSLMYKEVFQG